MVRAGAIAKRVITELEGLGCDIKTGCPANNEAKTKFIGRQLKDYYVDGTSD